MNRITVGVSAVACLAGLVLASSCLVDRKAKEFACETQADCADPRICSGGFCVIQSVLPDAPLLPDAPACPEQCTTCDLVLKTCTIACEASDNCNNVACPEGYACDIACEAGGCDDIDCSDAKSCKVSCQGGSACGNIDCGTGPCDVTCNGSNACDVIDCKDSCECDVTCDGGTDCQGAMCPVPTVPGPLCSTNPRECDSSLPNCKRICP